MRLNIDVVPSTHEAAVNAFCDALEQEEIDLIRLPGFRAASTHHSIGRHIRNAWSLWDVRTPLSRHYQQRWRLAHADDLSSLIIGEACANVRGEGFDRDGEVARFHAHWKAQGVDPMEQAR